MNSLINIESAEGAMSELDLFSVPVTNTMIENGIYVYYQPLAPVDNADVIEFVIPATDDYIDLSRTFLELEGKMTLMDGTALTADTGAIFPVNNFLHSLFKQVDVTLNDFQVVKGSQTYQYKAYIEKLLNYENSFKNTALSSCLWITDTPGYFNETDASPAGKNKGGIARQKYIALSETVQMADKLHVDIFNLNKYLLNNISVKIKLIRSVNKFYVMKSANLNNEYMFKITKANLKVRKVKVASSVQLAHNRVLTNLKTAKYPINYSEIKVFSVVQGNSSVTLDNIFLGSIPTRIIVSLVLSSGMEGSYTENPFNFKHFDINFMSLYIDGIAFPSKPYQPDFEKKLYLPCYNDFLEGCNKLNNNKSNGISRVDYVNGNCLFVFDLTPDLSGTSDHFNLIKQGSVRLEIKFAKTLPANVNILIYGESEHLMLIDSNRTVVIDQSK